MPRKPASKSSARPRKTRKRKFRIARFLPSAQRRRRWYRTVRRQRPLVQLGVVLVCLFVAWLALNWIYQVVRKPSELFFPVSGVLGKTPSAIWDEYAPIFREHSTTTMSPELLAALAQVEASGNPIVRTYWRWSFTSKPFDVFKPASSAVGMYQITNGTFAEAKRYCIHDHQVVEDGPWDNFKSCWFNWLYTRTIPSHAVEMTSAYLDRDVSNILARNHVAHASLEQRQTLAALSHLCGAGAGDDFARRGFRWIPGQKCGDHDARAYVGRVMGFERFFESLARKARE
jgi:Transglycosylase SLT domain